MFRACIQKNNRYYVLCTVVYCAILFVSCSKTNDQDYIVGPDRDDWASLYDWSNPDTWLDPYNWPNRKVISFAYSEYRAPLGFYQEDFERGNPYYENTISIRRPICPDYGCWFELCSDERDLAYAWSESCAVSSSYYRDYESERETDKYFEFRRVYEVNPNDVLLSRVHKCSYLDRTMHDKLHPTPVLGIFVPRPITMESSRELVEYMWANGMLRGYGSVISCSSSENPESFSHSILYVDIVYGDFGMCDQIFLLEMIADVEKGTGSITCDSQGLRQMNGVCHK